MNSKPKIMVVDDDPAICDVLHKYLGKKGYNITTFTNPKLALEFLKDNDYGLLLVDINMSEMSGIEVVKAVKGIKPLLPIIVMSGSSDRAEIEEVVKMGISGFFSKPFDLLSLLSSILTIKTQSLPDRQTERTGSVVY